MRRQGWLQVGALIERLNADGRAARAAIEVEAVIEVASIGWAKDLRWVKSLVTVINHSVGQFHLRSALPLLFHTFT